MSLVNDMKWLATLKEVYSDIDDKDRPIVVRKKVRNLYYVETGITAEEKFLSQQAKTNVVRRIKCRYDKSVSEKTNGVEISGIEYNIIRIYTNVGEREMELSLAYVD